MGDIPSIHIHCLAGVVLGTLVVALGILMYKYLNGDFK